jgi:flavin-dependent dehydrogenase
MLPLFIEDRAPRDGDERFVTTTARRPVLEYAFATCAENRADIRRGVTVSELVAGQPTAPGVPHVTGVRTSDGEHIPCDLVIDAMGRRSDLPRWLAALGARPPGRRRIPGSPTTRGSSGRRPAIPRPSSPAC